MLDVPEIQQRLTDRKIGMIAEETGLHASTIYKVRDKGVEANPTYYVIKKLSDYLQDNR